MNINKLIIKSGFLLLTIFLSCNAGMKSQTKEIIDINKVTIKEMLDTLCKEKKIDGAIKKQIFTTLETDLNYYLAHQDINADEINALFLKAVNSFTNFRISRDIYITISMAYYAIASIRMLKDYPPKIDMQLQTDVNKYIATWFDHYQTDAEKKAEMIALQKLMDKQNTQIEALPKINDSYASLKAQMKKRLTFMSAEHLVAVTDYPLIEQTIIGDIDFFEKDTTNNTAVLKPRLLSGLAKLKGKIFETEDREAVVDLYYILSQKKAVDINKELNKWLYDIDFKE